MSPNSFTCPCTFYAEMNNIVLSTITCMNTYVIFLLAYYLDNTFNIDWGD